VQGFAAISAQNGWAMAATGAAIVIIGLAILSLIISQLHKILGFFEKGETAEPVTDEPTSAAPPAVEIGSIDPLTDLVATARQYRFLTAQLGDSFGLAQLYHALETANAPHPHITVRELKASGFLISTDKGQFSWHNV
jgi:hypothetical protein